jgi:hypothetical protein
VRPGHLPRGGPADRAAGDRARRHRRPAHRPDRVPDPGARVVAPEPGLPVPARGGPPVRHGTVLLHRPGPDFRQHPPGRRARVQGQGHPGPGRRPGRSSRSRSPRT